MSGWQFVKSPAFLWTLRALAAASAALAAWYLVTGSPSYALVWIATAAVSVAFGFYSNKLPAFLGLVVALAAAVNAAGYTMSLWQQETSFDEAVHAFTTFAGTAVIGWLLVRRRGTACSSRARLVTTVIAIGLLLGIAWEGFETLAGMSGSIRDTIIDLVMDTIGSVFAAVLACWLASARED
jgi:VanZ family protein